MLICNLVLMIKLFFWSNNVFFDQTNKKHFCWSKSVFLIKKTKNLFLIKKSVFLIKNKNFFLSNNSFLIKKLRFWSLFQEYLQILTHDQTLSLCVQSALKVVVQSASKVVKAWENGVWFLLIGWRFWWVFCWFLMIFFHCLYEFLWPWLFYEFYEFNENGLLICWWFW